MSATVYATARMPCGKFRGQPVAAVPASYLSWCLETWQFGHQQWLRHAIAERLADVYGRSAPPPAVARGVSPESVMETVKAWRRDMALRYHPDRGGSDAACAAINDGYDRLVAALAALLAGKG